MDRRNPDEAPEAINLEQEDEGQNLGAVLPGEEDPEEVGETERVHRSAAGEVLPDDVPHLVEKMEEMVKSGRIDTDAFIGEPSHDDEPKTYGDEAAAEVDGDEEGEPDGFLR
jgi:hypothetical protein